MKILMVLTSHDRLGDTGKKTGFWLEEFAAPYYVFKDAGADVTLASPQGGQPPLDPKSDEPDAQTESTRRFEGDTAAQAALAGTAGSPRCRPADFDAVFYPGGHGPLWDLAEDKNSIALIETTIAGRQAGRRGLPRARRPAPRQGGGRHAAGQGQARHRLHQHRGGGRRPDRCRAVPGRGHAEARTAATTRRPMTGSLMS